MKMLLSRQSFALSRSSLMRPQLTTRHGVANNKMRSMNRPWMKPLGTSKYLATQSATAKKSGRMADMMMRPDAPFWWLFGCAGMVATTLTVGAAARLTKQGVSMLYWKPRSVWPPMNHKEWEEEYEYYANCLKRHPQQKAMSYEAFRKNYKWEYAHRLLGEATAVIFLGPLGYYYAQNKLPSAIRTKVLAIGGLMALQFLYGHGMALSQLNTEPMWEKADRLEHYARPYGLTGHMAFSLANLSLMMWSGLQLVTPTSEQLKVRELFTPQSLHEIGKVRGYYQLATGLLVATIAAGSMVAGTGAGFHFNTFPKMGDKWIPDGLWDLKPRWRNVTENIALVQLDHRLLAVSTLGAYTFAFHQARTNPMVWRNLPLPARWGMNLVMLAVGSQVLGGIGVVVNKVPMSLAMAHQSGAALLLGSSLWTLFHLRFARPKLLALKSVL